MHKSDAEKMDFILDEHDQAFLRQSRIATVQIILLIIVGVVSAVVVAVKVPQFAFIILGILYGTAMIVFFTSCLYGYRLPALLCSVVGNCFTLYA